MGQIVRRSLNSGRSDVGGGKASIDALTLNAELLLPRG